MKPWATWIASFILFAGAGAARAQGPGFVAPMPTQVPGSGFTPPMPTQVPGPYSPPGPGLGGPGYGGPPFGGGPGYGGEPTPVGPAMAPPGFGPGGGPGGDPGSGARPAGGVFPDAPPPAMMSLGNSPNGFDDDTPADLPWSCFSSFRVDLLFLNSSFDRNSAYHTNVGRPGGSLVEQKFSEDHTEFVPRLSLEIGIGELWSVRGSWMRFKHNARTEFIGNADPNTTVLSPIFLNGSYTVTQVDQFQLAGALVTNNQNTFIEMVPLQIISPRPFWFLSILPRVNLIPRGPAFPPPFINLPPFPFQNAVQAGFPDFLSFSSQVKTEVSDLEITRYVELNRATGTLGLGVRYGSISHNYIATRNNLGGRARLGNYDPFAPTIVPDADIIVNQDRESLTFAHTFGGTGPKLGFDLGAPISSFARLYGRANGSVLMGNRKQVVFYDALQQVTITDRDQAPPGNLFYTRTVLPQRVALRNDFTVVPLGEAEAGLEIVFGGRLFPVLKVGAFGQAWINGGNATNPNANLFLYGVNASLGFGW